MRPKTKASTKRKAPTTPALQSPTLDDERALSDQIAAVIDKLQEMGHPDHQVAAKVLSHVGDALTRTPPRLLLVDGVKVLEERKPWVTDPGSVKVLQAMDAAAAKAFGKDHYQPPKSEGDWLEWCIDYVRRNRRARKVLKTDPEPTEDDDETTVITLLHFLVQSLGVPPHATDPNPIRFVASVRADSATMAKLLKIAAGDPFNRTPEKLVAAVHRAIGYETTKKIATAKRVRAFKARQKAKRLASVT